MGLVKATIWWGRPLRSLTAAWKGGGGDVGGPGKANWNLKCITGAMRYVSRWGDVRSAVEGRINEFMEKRKGGYATAKRKRF